MDLSLYRVGTKVTGTASVRNGVTTPPKPFTDGDLISIMEDVSRYTEMQKSDAAILRARDSDGRAGIGTGRTRENIIAGLFDRGQIEFMSEGRQNKSKKVARKIQPSEKGIRTYLLLKEIAPRFVSPELTARWEEALGKIEDGSVTMEQFIQKQHEYCSAIANSIKSAPGAKLRTAAPPQIEPIKGHGDPCPKCGKGNLVTRQRKNNGGAFLACNNNTYDPVKKKATGCDYVDWGDKK